jgi:hypothetical protein
MIESLYVAQFRMAMRNLLMSDPTIAFLPQPVETLAREGEGFAGRIIRLLQRWVRSDRKEYVVEHFAHRLFVLNGGVSDWNVVVIVREVNHHDWFVDVCSVSATRADGLMEYFKPFADIDRVASVMQVRLDKIEPVMFSAVAESLADSWHRSSIIHFASHGHHHAGSQLMNVFDKTAHRWASSNARNHFKALLDDARNRPQLVERGGDDLFIVSRRYLQEAVEPTSARAMSRRYRAIALSDDNMPDFVPRELPSLEELPRLGST